MNLYLVTYKHEVGWDEFNGFVVRAMDPQDAKAQVLTASYDGQGGPQNWKAEKIGTADNARRGVVLASFHAG